MSGSGLRRLGSTFVLVLCFVAGYSTPKHVRSSPPPACQLRKETSFTETSYSYNQGAMRRRMHGEGTSDEFPHLAREQSHIMAYYVRLVLSVANGSLRTSDQRLSGSVSMLALSLVIRNSPRTAEMKGCMPQSPVSVLGVKVFRTSARTHRGLLYKPHPACLYRL